MSAGDFNLRDLISMHTADRHREVVEERDILRDEVERLREEIRNANERAAELAEERDYFRARYEALLRRLAGARMYKIDGEEFTVAASQTEPNDTREPVWLTLRDGRGRIYSYVAIRRADPEGSLVTTTTAAEDEE